MVLLHLIKFPYNAYTRISLYMPICFFFFFFFNRNSESFELSFFVIVIYYRFITANWCVTMVVATVATQAEDKCSSDDPCQDSSVQSFSFDLTEKRCFEWAFVVLAKVSFDQQEKTVLMVAFEKSTKILHLVLEPAEDSGPS